MLKSGFQLIGSGLWHFLAPAGRLLMCAIVLPIYRTGVMLRIKYHKLVWPRRGFALFFFSNRYLFHLVLGVAASATLIMNLEANQAMAQDVGQHSLLYALATNQEIEIVSETAPQERTAASHYLGSDTLTAIPHIDFDYNETSDEQTIAAITVPGTITAPPLNATERAQPSAPRTKTETYLVQNGDTIGAIAQKFDVNVGTILWSNGLGERQFIRPGDNLKIPPVSGILTTVKKGDTVAKLAKRYNGSEDEIRDFNKISNDSMLSLGLEIMVPGGRPPAPEETIVAVVSRQKPKTKKNTPKTSTATGEPIFPEPVISTPSKMPVSADTSKLSVTKLLWPTPGHVITQYYGWQHTGVDIDGDFTSPLYAAYDGVVTTAGWNNGGYGLMVLIQHPNGMVTRYGHASKLFVKAGDVVKRGQAIAMMGSTGRSTGSHLHFEVYVSGKRTNPLVYIR